MKEIKLKVEFDDTTEETGIVYIEALVNETSFDFVLDTGCKKSQLILSDFTNQFEKIGNEESSGAFGSAKYDMIRVNKLRVGTKVLKNFNFSRATTRKIEKNLLGMDFLKLYTLYISLHEQKIVLDYKNNSHLKLSKIYPDKVGKQPFIDVSFNDQDVRALWDSGAGITLIDSSFVKNNPENFKVTGEEEGTDSTGSKMLTTLYEMSGLEINGYKFEPHKIVSVDMSHVNSKSDTPIQFVIGFNAIKQANWFFDFKKNNWGIVRFLGLKVK